MMRIVPFVLVGFLAACNSAGQAQSSSAAEQELITLTKDLARAVEGRDRSILDRILADDFSFIHSNGVAMNKATEIAALTSADSKWTSAKLNDDAHARIYGDVGIVTGSETFEGSGPGMSAGRRMLTVIFVRRDGLWKCVGGQFTNAPSSQPAT